MLAPVVLREIYYRVLRGDLGSRLVDFAQRGSGSHRVVRAIEWSLLNSIMLRRCASRTSLMPCI